MTCFVNTPASSPKTQFKSVFWTAGQINNQFNKKRVTVRVCLKASVLDKVSAASFFVAQSVGCAGHDIWSPDVVITRLAAMIRGRG